MRRWFAGLSCGSSLLGIDAALVSVDGIGLDAAFAVAGTHHWPFPADLRRLLVNTAFAAAPALRSIGLLHRVLGESCAVALKQLLDQSRVSSGAIMAISSPGLLLCHDVDSRFSATLSLGMPAVLAERTGLTVLSDLRSRDVALGGQGQPLTALMDHRFFHSPQEDRALVHLGSSATLIWLPRDPGPGLRHLLGFQVGPGSLLLDGLMRLLTGDKEAYDPGGRTAVQGCCVDGLLERWLAQAYLRRKPPKTLARADYGNEFFVQVVQQAKSLGASLHDLLCTANHFLARSVAAALHELLPHQPARVLLSGGGVRNGLLLRLLREQLAPLPVDFTDDHGVPAPGRKAAAFAGLAALTLDNFPVNLPSVTGASGPRLLGQWTPGAAANWARCLHWMAAQTASPQLAAA